MSEGELKRQLKLVFPELKLKVETWIIPDISKVLDEAAKEFPATAIYNKYWADYDLNPKKDLTPPELIEEIAKWYLKWFGDLL